MVNGLNGKNIKVFLGIITVIILFLMEWHSISISSAISTYKTEAGTRITKYKTETDKKIGSLTEWRDKWVNRVRELDATQTADIQFLKESMKELKADVRALKAQCRTDADNFIKLLMDIRDRMPKMNDQR